MAWYERYKIDPKLLDIIKKDGFVFKDDEHLTWEGDNPLITFECELPNGYKKQLSVEIRKNSEGNFTNSLFAGKLEETCRKAVSNIMGSSSDDYLTNGYAVSALMDLLHDVSTYNDANDAVAPNYKCVCGCDSFMATETVRSDVRVKINKRGKVLPYKEAVEQSRSYTQFICTECGAIYDSLNDLIRQNNN